MKIKHLKYFLLFLILNCGLFSSAQFLQFQNLTMADGLSHSTIQSIGQDKYGFIWVGTENGLNIYDGIQFRHFFSVPENKTSIPGNIITDMIFEGDSVWLSTRNGLCKMDVISKKCKRIDIGDNRDVRTLFLEKNKRILWVGTNSGLIKYDIINDKFLEFNTSNSNISYNIIRSIYKDFDENLWIGTFNKLNKLPLNSTVFEIIDLKQNYRPKIKNNLILSILPYSTESDSSLWIGTQTGLVLYNRFSNDMEFFREENSGLMNSVCKTLLQTESGKVWVGTDFGLAKMNYDFEIKVHLHDPFKSNSLVNSIVWDIFEDNSGTIWFGTNNGISILSNTSNRFEFFPMTFNREENITGYEVRDIIEDSNENFWLATQFGVVNYNHEKQLRVTFNSEQTTNKRLTLNGTNNLLEDKK